MCMCARTPGASLLQLLQRYWALQHFTLSAAAAAAGLCWCSCSLQLAFLSYRQKLLAGSWRFLTYFGRWVMLAMAHSNSYSVFTMYCAAHRLWQTLWQKPLKQGDNYLKIMSYSGLAQSCSLYILFLLLVTRACRDTLISLMLYMRILSAPTIEAALSSVLERLNGNSSLVEGR